MARSIVLRDGPSTVILDGTLEEITTSLLGDVGPYVAQELSRALDKIETQARQRWPVGQRLRESPRTASRRPHSRDQLEFGVRIDVGSNTISAYAENSSDYAIYIKSGQHGLGGKNPWQELLRKPGIAASIEVGERFEGWAAGKVARGGR